MDFLTKISWKEKLNFLTDYGFTIADEIYNGKSGYHNTFSSNEKMYINFCTIFIDCGKVFCVNEVEYSYRSSVSDTPTINSFVIDDVSSEDFKKSVLELINETLPNDLD